MQVYEAPLRDMLFAIQELHRDDGYGDLEDLADFDEDLQSAILTEAARFMQEVIFPLNTVGDQQGCRLENGVVRTPEGFREAYTQFREGGWCALASEEKWGGQGAPESVNKMVEEMVSAANVSFGLYPGLTHGATTALNAHGSDELKEFYMPKLVSGEWSGTMCLTEAHCGTDLGMLRTKAAPQEDGSYRLTGSKIFISSGDHDLAENIVHLVLARLPDAPEGTRGISLFLVPKYLPDDDGNPGKGNGVRCSALEHKMGLKASATCQMQFEDSVGWLVGEPNKGMAAMFTMMNEERVGVGVQGLGLAEAAYQSAVYYARERIQGRSLSGVKYPDQPADPIIVHPDVRRMLMTMRAHNEGCRALVAWSARAIDATRHSTDPEQKQRASDFVALFTPVVKALLTDLGFESANLAVQTYGGHGYITESGVEQYVRDSRITMIYEGTNGIQALDLIGRKMPAHMGRYLRSFFHPVSSFIEAEAENAALASVMPALGQAFGALQLATAHIAQKGMKDPEEAGAAATDYLHLLGYVAMGFCFAKAMKIARAKLDEGTEDTDFYTAKIATAQFFFDRLLPPQTARFMSIKSGKASMMALDEAMF